MPSFPLKYDPATPEGKHIARLFRACKGIEYDNGGDWNGGDVVESLCNWFTSLGVDPDGHAYQVDAVLPEVIAPDATADTITQFLIKTGRFIAHGYPTGHEGFFHAEDFPDGCEDYIGCSDCDPCVLLTLPTASAPLVRLAVSRLRQVGYDARQVAAPAPASAIHVAHGALFAERSGASPAERAERILWLGGFTVVPYGQQPDAAGQVNLTPQRGVGERHWTSVDIVDAPTAAPDYTEEATRAIADLFASRGWNVDTVHAPDQVFVTPRRQNRNALTSVPIHTPRPADTPDVLPSQVVASVAALVEYNWSDEQRDFAEQDVQGQARHIFRHLNRLSTYFSLPQTTTPEARAASLFAGAFNTVFEDDPSMTIALHTSSGSYLAVAGELDDYRMRFDPAEVSTFLTWLTRAVASDPVAVITVTADPYNDVHHAQGWAWCIGTGAALNAKEAAKHFHSEELQGADNLHVNLSGHLVDTSAEGLSATSLTNDVKAVLTAHGEQPEPTTGHQITLRTDGTITVHITAADVSTARKALGDLDFEDFDVNLRTRNGALIGHITIWEADNAELMSVDGVPADELPDDTTH